MKLKTTAFRFIHVFFLLLLMLPMSLIVRAQETIITTVVPSTHTLTIEISGKGIVSVTGKQYSKTTEIQIPRLSAPLIEMKAAENYQLDSVYFNGMDITNQFSDNKWTMPDIISDAILIVDFESESGIPTTGDTSNICLWLILMLLALLGLIVCFWLYRKSKKRTTHI